MHVRMVVHAETQIALTTHAIAHLNSPDQLVVKQSTYASCWNLVSMELVTLLVHMSTHAPVIPATQMLTAASTFVNTSNVTMVFVCLWKVIRMLHAFVTLDILEWCVTRL